MNKCNENIKLQKQQSSLDMELFEERIQKMESFSDNSGVCVSLSSQWLSSIRQSESLGAGSDLFINDLKWIADIDEL